MNIKAIQYATDLIQRGNAILQAEGCVVSEDIDDCLKQLRAQLTEKVA